MKWISRVLFALAFLRFDLGPEGNFSGLPELIPREVLFGNPQKTTPRLSPDGKSLAFLAPAENGVMNIWTQTVGQADAATLTNHSGRGVRSFLMNWAFDNRHILYLQDNQGDEVFHVFMVDTKTKIIRDMTPFPGARISHYALGRKCPSEMLVSLNLSGNANSFEIYRVRLDTGALEIDTQIIGRVSVWYADENLVVRVAEVVDPRDGSAVVRARDDRDKAWRDLLTIPFGEKWELLSFLPEGNSALCESSLGIDTSRLVEIDLGTGRVLRTISGHDKCDLALVLIHPVTQEIQAVSYEYLKPEWIPIEEGVKNDFQVLQKFGPGFIEIESRDQADQKWAVCFVSDAGPRTYALYDRQGQTVEFLFEDRPELKKYQLAKMQPMLITARDGLELACYLSLPVGLEPKNLPLVLWVHGGPWARDYWGFERFAQILANRGYAVLQVNFRGSDGFGKKFLNAGNRQWGVGGMQHDLTDAVRWAVKKRIADPRRIAILGISYGGYAVLAGLSFTPELYACGVDMFGPCDVNGMMNSLRGPRRPVFLQRIGNVEADPEFNRRISPLYHCDKVKAPLLIGQGKNDPRVRIEETDKMVRALRAAHIPVQYVIYMDEGHTFQRPENNLDFWGHVEEFLGRHLGGRVEPYKKIPGSTGEIR
jgi:dipeptidyl aminopeptidase/acylaminoacyl peptidase